MNLLYRTGKVHLKDSLERAKSLNLPILFRRVLCKQGREPPPFATLQAWYSGNQRNAGGHGDAKTATFPQGILVVAAQETK